jgi:hypothetical protein
MDVFARHRTLGMADQSGDRHLGKAEIVGDAREAVTQDVGSHIGERGLLEEMLAMVREAAERVVLPLLRKDVCADIVCAPSLEIFDDRQANGTDGLRLLPWSLLFYFCQLILRVSLLVFLLVSAAIDVKNLLYFKRLLG